MGVTLLLIIINSIGPCYSILASYDIIPRTGIDLKKTGHILFFVVLLPAISFGIGWLFAELIPSAPFWVETLSPLAAYGILYGLFINTPGTGQYFDC